MIYSATVSQLMNSIETHSLHCGTDSIGTQSIANSASSVNSATSCKSISDPAVLFSKAVLDLKRAAREAEMGDRHLTEYWDTWNYWKKHPFAVGNVLLSGKLLLEHLLVLTNLKYENSTEIFESVKEWLQATYNTEISNNDITQLRDKLCAGFFLIYCTNFQVATSHLEEVKEVLVPEYFEALKGELEKRNEERAVGVVNRSCYGKSIDIISRLFFFFKEFTFKILDKMNQKHALLVSLIKSNSKAFLAFCQKLWLVLLSKLNISLF